MRDDRVRTPVLLPAALLYAVFVVYGSLIPFEYSPRMLEDAWAIFLRTPYLDLDVGARADWVANILLYIPLSFLCSAVTAGVGQSGLSRALSGVVVFAIGAALAVSVEFAQLFFPPRTVSLNDITAELTGTLAGIIVWEIWGRRILELQTRFRIGGPDAIQAAFVVFALAYMLLSLFPYDFILSTTELIERLHSNHYGLFMAPSSCERTLNCAGKLLTEVIAVVPLGFLLSLRRESSRPVSYGLALTIGLSLGVLIEGVQLLVNSAISQGVSVLTRGVGVVFGVAMYRGGFTNWLQNNRHRLNLVVTLGAIPYLVVLAWLNGWFSRSWMEPEQALQGLATLRWLPFYYHYYVAETAALISVMAFAAMYAPMGVACWAWEFARAHSAGAATLRSAGWAALLAALMEVGKLFLPGKHPDTTDVLIAACAAAIAYQLAVHLQLWSSGMGEAKKDVRNKVDVGVARAPVRAAGLSWIGVCVLLVFVGGIAVRYPLPGPWLLLAIIGYGVAIWRFPEITLPAVLALVPVLNFAPLTGWVLVDESDLLVSVTLIVNLIRSRDRAQGSTLDLKWRWIIVFLGASYLISAVIGLMPLQPFGADALSGNQTGYNSVRALKGFLWAFVLLAVIVRQAISPEELDKRIVAGMAAGLCVVSGVAIWERFIFAGLFNFSDDYRITATFPEMHTGGAFAEAYLVMAIPFAVAWIMLRPSLGRILSGAALVAMSSYALAVTFARAGYLGYSGALAVLGLGFVIYALRHRAWKPGRLAIVSMLGLAGIAAALPIVTGSFMQTRFATTQTDIATRTRHWSDSIDMMDSGATTTLFGMGLGSFPRAYLYKAAPDSLPATFSYQKEGNNQFVRLGSGKTLYLGQRVQARPAEIYTLSVDVRSADKKAVLSVWLCERSELYAFRCEMRTLPALSDQGKWRHHEVKINSDQVGLGSWLVRRPVVFGIHESGGGAIVEVDNIHLVNLDGDELIANGDFSHGGDRWYFATDDHLPWHIKHLWLQVYFEQGWLGVTLFSVLVLIAAARLAIGTWRGDFVAAAWLASLCGFLLVGLFDSLFDAQRLTTLFLLLLFVAVCRPVALPRFRARHAVSPLRARPSQSLQ